MSNIIKFNKTQFADFQDKILAHHFSLVKFISAFQRRNENIQKFVMEDRFSLKVFLQEYNVIRHVPKDHEETIFKYKNIVRLSAALNNASFKPYDIDEFVGRMYAKKIFNIKATSLCSKIFFLGNPNEIYMYDSYVRKALKYRGSYSEFYDRIQQLIAIDEFSRYVNQLHERVKPKIDIVERWARFRLTKNAQRIRIIDRYLMVVAGLGESLDL